MAKYFKARVNEGVLKMDDKQKFTNSVKYLQDGEYVMVLLRVLPGDLNDCRKLYFAKLNEWTDDVGYTKEELHEIVKSELFPDLFGNISSTSDLNTAQWTILVREVNNFLILKFRN